MSTVRKISKERRNSGRRSLAGSATSFDLSRRNDLPEWAIEEMQRIADKQEQDLVVYAVREELMDRVMDACYKKYMEEQGVKFIVHCAMQALRQLLNIEFFNHDSGRPFYMNHPSYSADTPLAPSPRDSWAAGTVPIKLKPPPAEVIPVASDNDLDICSVNTYTFDNVFQGFSNVGSADEMEVLYEASLTEDNEPSSELLEVTTASDMTIPNVSEVSLDKVDVPTSPLSIFTLNTRMPPETLRNSMKTSRSKFKSLDFQNRPQFSIVDSGPFIPKFGQTALPPLRKEIRCHKGEPEPPEAQQD